MRPFLFALTVLLGIGPRADAATETFPARGHYAMVEIRFDLPDLAGNPFNFTENDIRVDIHLPDGKTVRVPAFFDGGSAWRVRYTPQQAGGHKISGVSRNGIFISGNNLAPKSFEARGPAGAGFVRRDSKDAGRFVFDNGQGYYPIGHNAPWGDGKALTVPSMLEKMGRSGENWSRIWMCHWDGKNLDWVEKKKIPLGTLDLEVARRWDGIVEAAEKSGVRFQMVLQHHGPYSTTADSNWGENPWNAVNGGFLKTPHEFFTDAHARALTRAKYRYIVARWGYSPSIMAWELFNEVQWTDAIREGKKATVAAWHNVMADFLREHDPYRHLVTSSFWMDPTELGDRLDYWQPHAYVPDPVVAVTALNGLGLDRPVFLGEIGPAGGSSQADADILHRLLWASMMTEAAGAAQYWAWETVENRNLYPVFKRASAFLKWSGLAGTPGLKSIEARVETETRGPLSIAPGGGWEQAKQTEFTVTPSGAPGLGQMPRYLQGKANRALFPSATFNVEYDAPGMFRVRIGQVAKAGGAVTLELDGRSVETRSFAASERDTNVDADLEIPVPAGRHTVRLLNPGADWVTVDRITLDPYAPQLSVLGRASEDLAVFWLESRADPDKGISGRLVVPGRPSGTYTVQWWDTHASKALEKEQVAVSEKGDLSVPTPLVTRDVACLVRRER